MKLLVAKTLFTITRLKYYRYTRTKLREKFVLALDLFLWHRNAGRHSKACQVFLFCVGSIYILYGWSIQFPAYKNLHSKQITCSRFKTEKIEYLFILRNCLAPLIFRCLLAPPKPSLILLSLSIVSFFITLYLRGQLLSVTLPVLGDSCYWRNAGTF